MKIRDEVIKVLGPEGTEEDIEAIAEVIRSGWWGNGPKTHEFEQEFAKLVGHKYALGVTSNSHGQDLIFKALGFKDIDVINPTMSFITTAVVPLWNNCTTNIVDVDELNLCITPEEIEQWKKPNSEVCIAVNMAGRLAPIDDIRRVFDGFIIEDCAHSCYTHGAGLRGDVAVWSFQAVKTLPMGDGGMITTDNKELYEKMKDIIWFNVSSTWSRVGKQPKKGYTWEYDVIKLGYKYYMIDILAALGLSQLKKLPFILSNRRYMQTVYNTYLHDIVKRPPYSETVQYYIARVPEKDRDNLVDYLKNKNIHTSVHFQPLHKYTFLKNTRTYPVADKVWKTLITLPCGNTMTGKDAEYVIYWVNKFFNERY
jgi:perosamine synthetase